MNIKEIILNHAKANDINVNYKSLDSICAMLQLNIDKHGFPYCPCTSEKNSDNICPCKYHMDEIVNNGRCHCNLFIK